MITKTLMCDYCGKEFQRTDYPSRFRYNNKHYTKCYCSKHCAFVGAREGYRPTQGIIIDTFGRLLSREPNHPNRNKNSQIPVSHLVMEVYIGRYLEPNQVIHHIDGNPLNNYIGNLQLMTIGEHVTLHNNLKGRDNNGRFTKSLS